MCTENDIRVSQVTESAAECVARQITEAFPWNESPRYVIRDRDRIYGTVVTRRLRAMGIRDKPIAPSSLAERLIGSIRRECLDHVIVSGEAHLRRILNHTPITTTAHQNTHLSMLLKRKSFAGR